MTKAELSAIISESSGLSKTASDKVLNDLIEGIKNEIERGGSVQIVGFGTLKLANRKSRNALSPVNGKPIVIPACKTPAFRVSDVWKKKCNAVKTKNK